MSGIDRLWQPHDWETAFFGIKTARILPGRLQQSAFERALVECQAWGAQVAHVLLDSNHDQSISLVEQVGFHFVDIRLTLEWAVLPLTGVDRGGETCIRQYDQRDLPALQAIARDSYYHSRYYYDHHYSRQRCGDLYAEWIRRSTEEANEHIVVAERGGALIGFITCRTDTKDANGQIGLVGISADARGLGAGRLLLGAAQIWFGEQGSQVVTVVTQGRNIEAQRLYQRCGFVTRSVQLWYHKWF